MAVKFRLPVQIVSPPLDQKSYSESRFRTSRPGSRVIAVSQILRNPLKDAPW